MNRNYTLAAGLCLLTAGGCASHWTVQKPLSKYARPIAAGQSSLRRVTDPTRLPDLAAAYTNADSLLSDALEESLQWFATPSSHRFFPFQGISHARAEASLAAFKELLASRPGAEAFASDLVALFDVYESIGYDGTGTVLFTGYYAPIFAASRTPTGRFAFPLYKRPTDLVTDPKTGVPLGRRRTDETVVPYYTRRQIETSQMLGGNELVWLEDPLSVYIVHVNGSARLKLQGPEGPGEMYVGYAGKTDRPYTGLGALMMQEGLLQPDNVNLSAIKRIYQRSPDQVTELIYRNESYVFFTEYGGDRWPMGSLGVRVTPKRTLATDKKIYPRGGLVLVDTEAVSFGRRRRPFLQLMLDQDTGGAIRAPGRADIFMGIGPEAEILAGGQFAEGRLYYLFLKPPYVQRYAR